ncbi:hypothetical protein [Rhizobium sp. BE258]|uniref:hypothetical protein n=1 Tax=Rhizobium sp. BE258 TaxID=2817722 RepID=UPI00286248AD|nr:hypothetical protein [Rhizobium sp. BE258]MDR7145168.1 hypothetical protein [Rhizobium sp. BE258]
MNDELAVISARIGRATLKVLAGSMGLSLGIDIVEALSREKGDVDKRLAKIEAARENLLEALSAIDDIKIAAQEHKKELAEIQTSVKEIGKERDKLTADKNLLVQMTAAEKDRLREMLGVPTRLQSVLIWVGTFIFGCLTTWIVTYAYDFKIKELLRALIGG